MNILEAAIWVVDAFDQANTAGAITGGPPPLDSRGKILAEAIEGLRAKLNDGKKRTRLTAEQANNLGKP